jgi:hypothetical protein
VAAVAEVVDMMEDEVDVVEIGTVVDVVGTMAMATMTVAY